MLQCGFVDLCVLADTVAPLPAPVQNVQSLFAKLLLSLWELNYRNNAGNLYGKTRDLPGESDSCWNSASRRVLRQKPEAHDPTGYGGLCPCVSV